MSDLADRKPVSDGESRHAAPAHRFGENDSASRSREPAAACDCHLHENQVCDICQGVDPDNPPRDVERTAARGRERPKVVLTPANLNALLHGYPVVTSEVAIVLDKPVRRA